MEKEHPQTHKLGLGRRIVSMTGVVKAVWLPLKAVWLPLHKWCRPQKLDTAFQAYEQLLKCFKHAHDAVVEALVS